MALKNPSALPSTKDDTPPTHPSHASIPPPESDNDNHYLDVTFSALCGLDAETLQRLAQLPGNKHPQTILLTHLSLLCSTLAILSLFGTLVLLCFGVYESYSGRAEEETVPSSWLFLLAFEALMLGGASVLLCQSAVLRAIGVQRSVRAVWFSHAGVKILVLAAIAGPIGHVVWSV